MFLGNRCHAIFKLNVEYFSHPAAFNSQSKSVISAKKNLKKYPSRSQPPRTLENPTLRFSSRRLGKWHKCVITQGNKANGIHKTSPHTTYVDFRVPTQMVSRHAFFSVGNYLRADSHKSQCKTARHPKKNPLCSTYVATVMLAEVSTLWSLRARNRLKFGTPHVLFKARVLSTPQT